MRIEYVDIGNIDYTQGITDVESFLFTDAPSRAGRIVRQGMETRRDIGPAGPPLRLELQVTLRSTEVNRQEPRALAAVASQFSLQTGL